MNKQKGFSAILLLIIVIVILGIGFYIYQMKDPTIEMVLDEVLPDRKEETMMEFEEVEEPTGTPEEINSKALDELDALMNEVDATSTGEDLSDL